MGADTDSIFQVKDVWDYQSDLLIIAYKAQIFEKMVLKILLATLSLSSLVSCLPQRGSGDTPLCSEYPGYSCVPDDKCTNSQSYLEDSIFSDGADLLQIRGSEKPEDAFCGTAVKAIRTSEITNTAVRGAEEELRCCKDSNIAPGYIKPETDNADDFDKCSDFKSEGYRCVQMNECSFGQEEPKKEAGPRATGIRSGNEDAVNSVCEPQPETDPRSTLVAMSDGAGVLGVRGAEEICCHESDIKKDTPSPPKKAPEPEIKLCENYASEGYNCVSAVQCEGEIDPRQGQSVFDVNPTCKKSSDICCHESKVKLPDLCVDYSRYGYKCVAEDLCVPPQNTAVRGAGDEDAENAICDGEPKSIGSSFSRGASTGIRSSGSGQVCCFIDHIQTPVVVTTPKPAPARTCSSHARDGFKCVDETKCLDQVFINSDEGLKVGQRRSKRQARYEPHKATCPASRSSKQVCCSNIKTETIYEEKCSDSAGYECLPITKCNLKEPVAQAESESEVLDIRGAGVGIDHNISLCLGDDEICCSPARRIPIEPINTDQNQIPDPKVIKPEPYKPKCGQHNEDGIGVRISNPQDMEFATQFGEWPHVCMIMKKNTAGTDAFLGGASLIAPGIVVTAAHKVNAISPSDMTVRCGDWNIKQVTEPKKFQEKQVKTLSIHPRYSGIDKVHNDVALVHLDGEFVLDKHLDTICLPEFPDQRDGNYQKGKLDCSVQGWGKSCFGDCGKYQAALRQINLPIVENDVCQNLLQKTRLPDSFDLHDSFLCAGGSSKGGEDACEGDGGGPLVCRQNDKFVLAGVVAWGIGCGVPNVPGVYAAVADVVCWIDWVTKCKHGNDFGYFYNYPQCDNWIDTEIFSLESSSDPNDKVYLKRAELMKTSCQRPNFGQIGPRGSSNNLIRS